MKKIVTIIGARPQFIKAAAVSRAIRESHAEELQEILVHTGQHYDPGMSDVFFDELEIPAPGYNLGISGGSHGSMTGQMLEKVEAVLLEEKPDWVLVYGDTNSTLAGALAAAKLHIPVAHVEAGLRSFNMRMPEEINRILTDRVSTLLFCPTEVAVANLAKEGVQEGVLNVGDVMYDVALFFGEKSASASNILATLGLDAGNYALATCHRAENTDAPERLESIFTALAEIAGRVPVVLPIHPRTDKLIKSNALEHLLEKITVIEPVSFLDMVALERQAGMILTDSGGVQKEAFFYDVPCITMRDETEWVETVEAGGNTLVGASSTAIVEAASAALEGKYPSKSTAPYGNGQAARAISRSLI